METTTIAAVPVTLIGFGCLILGYLCGRFVLKMETQDRVEAATKVANDRYHALQEDYNSLMVIHMALRRTIDTTPNGGSSGYLCYQNETSLYTTVFLLRPKQRVSPNNMSLMDKEMYDLACRVFEEIDTWAAGQAMLERFKR